MPVQSLQFLSGVNHCCFEGISFYAALVTILFPLEDFKKIGDLPEESLAFYLAVNVYMKHKYINNIF
jgi:hypothetical protein